MKVRESVKKIGKSISKEIVGSGLINGAKLMIQTKNPVCIVTGVGMGIVGYVCVLDGACEFGEGVFETIFTDENSCKATIENL